MPNKRVADCAIFKTGRTMAYGEMEMDCGVTTIMIGNIECGRRCVCGVGDSVPCVSVASRTVFNTGGAVAYSEVEGDYGVATYGIGFIISGC